jgi:hypothetical protein
VVKNSCDTCDEGKQSADESFMHHREVEMQIHERGIRGGTAPLKGFQIVYHAGESNHCPGCDRQHWLVGRITAECSFCGTALPLGNSVHGYGADPRFITSRPFHPEKRPEFQPVI